METRAAQQLADAYEYVAKVNHYMVGIVETRVSALYRRNGTCV